MTRTHRHSRTAAPRPAHLGHRPLQLPLHLLHAEGGVRPRLRVPAPRAAADVRGDRAAGAAVRGRRRRPRSASPAASRCCAATSRRWSRCSPGCAAHGPRRPHPDHQRLAAAGKGARRCATAGLDRVTVSLDSLDDDVFQAMNDVRFPVARVLEGIDAAPQAGLPVKVNMVVKRGVNDGLDRGHGRALPRQRHHPALHRVHGRRHHQRLAPGRRRARRGDASTGCRPAGRWSRSRRSYPGEVASRATATSTAAARSASSPRSPGPSAAAAPAPACRPRASSTPACSPPTAPTCGGRCATARATSSWPRCWAGSGGTAATATPSCAAPRRRDRPRVEMSHIGG